jgi:hypothetical protein
VKTNAIIAILVVVGLLGHLNALKQRPATAVCGADFPIFYAGAELVGSANLYSPVAVQQMEQREIGCSTPWAAFIRLPYFAAMLRPLTWLPVRTAFVVWRVAALAAVIVFLALLGRQWKWALLACVWSNALTWDLYNGQDIAFLLLVTAAVLVLVQRKREFAAGLCLALCANKFHLFILLPLLLARRDTRKTSAGALAGGAALLAMSFLAGGWSWPADYARAMTNPLIDPAPQVLSNLRGLARGSWNLEIVLGLTVVAAVGCVCRRAKFELGFAAVIAGGLLISHHFTASDPALLIPVALVVVQDSSPFASALAVLLITPLGTVLNQPQLVTVTLLVLLYALAYGTLCQPALLESKDSVLKTSPAR